LYFVLLPVVPSSQATPEYHPVSIPLLLAITESSNKMADEDGDEPVTADIVMTAERRSFERKTERVSGSKKTSPIWEFIHRLVNGALKNSNGKLTEYVCMLCAKDKKSWTSLKLFGYIHRTDYCGIGVLTYGRTGYSLPLLHLRHHHVSICPDVDVRTLTLHIRDSKLNANPRVS
jgi:hypothetical protein